MVSFNPAVTEKVFKTPVQNGFQKGIRLQRQDGKLKEATVSTIKSGKEEIGAKYSFCDITANVGGAKAKLISHIQEICNQVKDGAILFADIMGWLK